MQHICSADQHRSRCRSGHAQLEANKKEPSQQKASGLMAKLEALQKEQERLQKERQERMGGKKK